MAAAAMTDHGGDHSSFTTVIKLASNFLQAAKEMAKPILEAFGVDSDPVTIDSDDLYSLKQKLGRISVTISAAENLDLRDEYDKLWLGELRDLECMAIDIVEEFEYEELHSTALHGRSLEPRTSGAGEGRVGEVISSHPSYLRRKLEKMIRRHRDVASDRKDLSLESQYETRRHGSAASRPSSTSSLDGVFYGRDEEVKEVLKLLLLEKPHCNYSVVPIVGMPGVGKTALVQHVNKHELVTCRFDFRMWVSAADGLDAIKITKDMMEEITGDSCGLTQLNAMQKSIGNLLKGKRFLLVLDDLWDVQSFEHWETLQIPFAMGAWGSKVIVTSNYIRIGAILKISDTLHLKCLSDDICWSICKYYASHGCDYPNSYQKIIGKAVVKKCDGLPLAAKALGRLLYSSFSEDIWRDLLEKDLCTDDEFMERTLPAFKRIYDHLPAYLKRCFASCSLFPKGYIFEKNQLVRLWIAQGFVPGPASGYHKIEDKGVKYFGDLEGWSIFQPSPFHEGREEMYVMHDLFHELAELVSDNEFCRSEDYRLYKLHYKTRHSSLSPREEHSEKLMQLEPLDGKELRSLLFIGRLEFKLRELSFNIQITENIFTRLQCLRALDLKNSNVVKLPWSICILKHLRYLCLQNTRIRRLPESLCFLYNLHTLDLRHCYHLEELPQGMMHLLNLVHLQLPLADYLDIRMPSGIGKLTCLQTMSAFVVGNDPMRCGLSELKDLSDLGGELHICNLNYVNAARDAVEANLKDKDRLQELTLQWSRPISISYSDAEVGFGVLEKLQPPYSIRALNVKDYYGISFPNWMGDSCYSKLVFLNLQECADCIKLPPLGQLPSLIFLNVCMMKSVKYIGIEFCGMKGKGFQKLERLEFTKMLAWREWSGVEDGDFPCLQTLVIKGCPELELLPKLHHLRELVIHGCEKLHSLSELPMLQAIDIVCCKQLVSVPGLEHLTSLREFKVKECPKLDISVDMKLNLNCNTSPPCIS